MMARSVVPTSARNWVRSPIAAVMASIGVVVVGSMASVSAAEQAVPGDLLFPIKLVSEQTRLALAGDRTARVRLKAEFVNRRVDEIKKIALTDTTTKPARLKEATEILRRDLDTVKNQLAESSQDKPADRVEVAKLVDQTGTDVAAGLKEAKSAFPSDIRPQVTEVETAAVNASVKAVDVIITTQDQNAGMQNQVSKADLIQSITQKVEGVSDHIISATQQLSDAGILSTTATTALASSTATISSSLPTILKNEIASSSESVNASSSVADILGAHASLAEARQLLAQDRLTEVGDKLIAAAKFATSAEQAMQQIISAQPGEASTTSSTPPILSSSSSPSVLVPTSTTSTTSSATQVTGGGVATTTQITQTATASPSSTQEKTK